MDVSENRGTPQIIHFNRVFHYKPSILGYIPLFLGNTQMPRSFSADWLQQNIRSKVWTPYLDVWRLKLQRLYVPGRWPEAHTESPKECSWTLHAFQNLGKVTGINRCSKLYLWSITISGDWYFFIVFKDDAGTIDYWPVWKICSSNWMISPGRDENTK